MGNFKDSISKKPRIDMDKRKFMSGVVVMIYLRQTERVWKCVQKEQSLILKKM